MQKRWNIRQADPARVSALRQGLPNVDPVLIRILAQRGITDFDQARSFFRPQLTELHDPWSMRDMDKAVDRILTAFQNKEKILVFGDYDVDGTTAVACLFQFFVENYLSNLVDFYIPHRYREGYGVSRQGIDFAADNGFTLIVSLDCGIKSIDHITYAKSIGIDFIVCDHHLPDDELPPAVAILNPKQEGCGYPYKELCGCGVGYKLITALCDRLGLNPEEPHKYLDLVATAIAADIVPVDGENRILAYYGLRKVNEEPNSGIRALIDLSAKQRILTMTNLVFMIAPRVNAAGRMDDARKVVLMFTTPDPVAAKNFADILHSDNTDRKEADLSMTVEALELIKQLNDNDTRRSTVLFQPHWHKGVVGIVASRLIEQYYRPTVVLTKSGDLVAGSARSVNGFNLYEAIHACREHLVGYGGHFAAAGVTLLPAQVEAFTTKFEAVVTATITPDSLVPEIIIDAELPFAAINPRFYRILEQMQPFGPGNAQPVFITRGVIDKGNTRIVKEQHIRFSLFQDNHIMDGIGFGLAHKFHLIEAKQPIDIVFTLEENVWANQTTLQLRVIDFRLSTPNE